MKRSPVVEEELQRSFHVYFTSFLAVRILDDIECIQIGGIETLVLALVLTIAYFKLMAGYRKRKNLKNPSISSIIEHMLKRQKPERRNTGYTELGLNFRSILAILVITYLVYLYAI